MYPHMFGGGEYIKVSCLNRNRPKRVSERERVNLFKIIHVYVFLLLKGRRTALLLKCAFKMCKWHENESKGKEDVEGRMRRCCNYTKKILTQIHVVFSIGMPQEKHPMRDWKCDSTCCDDNIFIFKITAHNVITTRFYRTRKLVTKEIKK